MNRRNSYPLAIRLLLCIGLTFFVLVSTASSQTEEEIKEALVKSVTLLDAGKYLEAEPYLVKLVKAVPDSAELRMMYGTVLLVKSKQISDNDAAKKAAALALEQFQAAKRLGANNPDLDEMIAVLGGAPNTRPTSNIPKSSFDQAEIKFAQSKYNEALPLYRKALEEDPKNYLAALYSADCLMQLGDYENAEKYYQKAIEIDPDRETAY